MRAQRCSRDVALCLVFQSCLRTMILSKSLSLNLSLSHSLLQSAESHASVVLFFQKGWRKRERKKKSRVQKTFVLKTTTKKARAFFTTTTTKKKKISLQNFSSLILLSRERKKERKKERKMHFQVVNCPSQVRTLRIVLLTERERERERDLSFSLSLNSFFSFFFRFRLLRFDAFVASRLCVCLCERIESRKRNWKWCRSRSRTFSLWNHQSMMCVLCVLLNNTGFSVNELRVRLPVGLLRKMYHQSVHRIKRHRPLRETARHHSPRANRLKRSAKETLASEHRGRDSSAPIPNTRHVDQWW